MCPSLTREPHTPRIRRGDSAAPSHDVAPSAPIQNLYRPSSQEYWTPARRIPRLPLGDKIHFTAQPAGETKER
ncbi:unnamed protein product [Danaus chrysippus]|uniref:(African queen) hypothetical protein n=1 Tax=Danaus chrysippus TaxID=151541 RepID=A0A8J2VTU5_9NEOP|nr:unnamed protein product [Danaus chrysippus]